MAPVAARRGTILEAEREDDDDEDIAVRPPMARDERTPVDRRLSMVVSEYTRSSGGSDDK